MKHLFLGGSRHGEFHEVPDERHSIIFPKQPKSPLFRQDAPFTTHLALETEEYVRHHQSMPHQHWDAAPVYLLRGQDLRVQFSRWLTNLLIPEPPAEELLRDPSAPQTPNAEPEIVLEVPPHVQVSVGGRTIRWIIDDTQATLAMQSFVQAMGPGQEIE